MASSPSADTESQRRRGRWSPATTPVRPANNDGRRLTSPAATAVAAPGGGEGRGGGGGGGVLAGSSKRRRQRERLATAQINSY